MTFNLLMDPFLPVRTRSGDTRTLALTELPFAEDAIEPDWPRADFNSAAMELLIGIAALAMQPRNIDDWAQVWENGPNQWEARLQALEPAFDLLGHGARFLQEQGGLDGKAVPIEALLIDSPGANGKKKNSDLLTHRDRYVQLGLPAAAMAVYTLQAYAPAGGAGHHTSMRGGGPLSTLVIPQADLPVPLWRKVWANVPNTTPVRHLEHVCHWLKPGVVPGKICQGHELFHDLHAFFGMPRRLSLIESEGCCALTGQEGRTISAFFQKPRGIDYGFWVHPLTPYKRLRKDTEPFSAKPTSARFRAAEWVLAALDNPPLRQRARTVTEAERSRIPYLRQGINASPPRLRVSGWNMKNMEATDWLVAEEPLYYTGDSERDAGLSIIAKTLASAVDEAAGRTVIATKIALFGPVNPDVGRGVLADVRETVLNAGDSVFHEWMRRAFAGTDRSELLRSWSEHLRKAAFDAFDRATPIPIADPQKARRILFARRHLAKQFDQNTTANALKQLIEEVA